MRLVLYQPDIPQNTGTMLRLAACLGLAVDLIEPAGFFLNDRTLKRAGLDYIDHVTLIRHVSYEAFENWRRERNLRVVLLTTRAATRHLDFAFQREDCIMVGRESAGVPEHVHAAADAVVRIPILPPLRSLNVAVSAAIALGEAMRQTEMFNA